MIPIKTYQEDFLDKQIELVHSVTNDWTFFNYPTKEQLTQTYSADNFTPDTRFYAFDGDKLVGFLSTAIQNKEEKIANLQYPFVFKGYENVESDLMIKAMKVLKSKGMEQILTTGRTNWDPSFETFKRNGFEEKELLNSIFYISTDTFDFPGETLPEISIVDPVKDKDELIRVFQTEMIQTPEQIGQIIDGWKDAPNVFINVIAKIDSKIVSHSMVVQNPNSPKVAFMTHVSIYDKRYMHFRKAMVKYILQACKKDGFSFVNLFAIPKEEFASYESFDFPEYHSVRFSKNI